MPSRSNRLACSVIVLALGLGAADAAAQFALDANPSVSGGSRNRPAPKPVTSREIYSVNRSTGTMVYNRANAFNDSVYSIYQRYNVDRFSHASTQGVSTSAALERRTPMPSAVGSADVTRGNAGTNSNTRPRARGRRDSRIATNAMYVSRPDHSPARTVNPAASRIRPVRPAADQPSKPPRYSIVAGGDEPRSETPSGARMYSVFQRIEWPWSR
ncbi:MAG: hypothetical protein AAGA55_04180 [Planctomycetota bacterium]